MAILYLLAEELVQNEQQQDCCLIVEVHAPDGIDNQWVQQTVESAIKEQFGQGLTLWSAHEEEAFHCLETDPDATMGALNLSKNVSVIWNLARIV
jgi:hypothetical protein